MTEPSHQLPGGAPGLGVDSQGHPVVDPTQNVRELVEAAIQRQDDLRIAESRHVREIAQLRAEYAGEIRAAETARIDAIRAVDVTAVQQAASAAEARATALAAQVAASAEAMRNQVAAAATAAATSLAAALVPIQESIADLRRAQYEQQGSKAGGIETRSAGSQQNAFIFSIIGLVMTIILAGTAIVGIVLTH